MKKGRLKIAMLGAGNLAWHLAPALEAAGNQITLVYSRTLTQAQTLASRLANAQATNTLNFTATTADLFLLAISDSALPEVLSTALFPENSLVAHTSGTQPLSVFQVNPKIIGAVFYPLQTFSKEVPVNFGNVPFCLETSDKNAMDLLEKTAGSLSDQVFKISSEERKILHLAAVFACNFTNHLFGISSEIMAQNQLNFKMLQPLVNQTVQKAFLEEPFSVQTGPAVRRDQSTLQAHLELLEENVVYRQIYELLSASIQQKSGKTD